MAQKLQGKSAIVTGGGSGGIGKAVAFLLAAEGAQVVVNDIGKDASGKYLADNTVDEIKKTGGKAVANYDSVATKQGGENIIKTAVSNFGKIDILVNCAGNFKPVPSLNLEEADWMSIINVHLNGHFYCIKPAITEMAKQKSGCIINFSSRGAFKPAGNLAYSAAKSGILGMTSALAVELKQYNISVNAIVPSADTKLFPGMRPKNLNETMPASISLEPDYIAPVVAYLCTDAAKDITGRYFYASGGDICIYGQPLALPGTTPVLVRKMAKWTIDELNDTIHPLLGLG